MLQLFLEREPNPKVKKKDIEEKGRDSWRYKKRKREEVEMKGNKGRERKENEKRLKEIEGRGMGKKKWVKKKR